jgi:hypothetical protein
MGLSATPAASVFAAATVLPLAEASRWRAPDVTAALAEHAVRLAKAERDLPNALRAEGWLAHGLIAIGRGWAAAPRAAEALAEANRLGEVVSADRLRVELASLARAVNAPTQARLLLDPVLERSDLTPALRADASLEAALATDRGDREARALLDRAVAAFTQVGGEAGELGLAYLDAMVARQHRERGELAASIDRARDGLRRALGDRLANGALEPASSRLATMLCGELCVALADSGHPEPIREISRPMLHWSLGPGLLGPTAALRLVLASRVHRPAGEWDAALAVASWVAQVVESRDLPELEAASHGLLAEIREARGELPEALEESRRAEVALRSHNARMDQARALLAQVAGGPEARAGRELGRSSERAATGIMNGFAPMSNEWSRPAAPLLGRSTGHALNGHAAEPVERHHRRNGSSTAPSWLEPLPPPNGITSNLDRPESNGQVPGRRRAPEPAVPDPLGGVGTASLPAVGSGPDLAVPLPSSDPAASPITGRRRRPEPAQQREPVIDAEPSFEDAESDLDVMWLAPGEDRGERPTEPAGPAWLTEDELADRLTELTETAPVRPSHLVVVDVVDTASPDGSQGGAEASMIAVRIANCVTVQLPADGHLFLIEPGTVTIALPEPNPRAVSHWVRAVSAGLSQRWPELSVGFPNATFRIAVRPLDPAWSMSEHVREVLDKLHGPDPGRRTRDTDATSDQVVPRRARHDAGETEAPAHDGAAIIASRFVARPGSGGRRRRAEPGDGAEPVDEPRASSETDGSRPLYSGLDLAEIAAGGLRFLDSLDSDQPAPVTNGHHCPPATSTGYEYPGAEPAGEGHPGRHTDPGSAAEQTESERSAQPRPPSWDRPVSELSFAELIDGALAAYREA